MQRSKRLQDKGKLPLTTFELAALDNHAIIFCIRYSQARMILNMMMNSSSITSFKKEHIYIQYKLPY